MSLGFFFAFLLALENEDLKIHFHSQTSDRVSRILLRITTYRDLPNTFLNCRSLWAIQEIETGLFQPVFLKQPVGLAKYLKTQMPGFVFPICDNR